MGCKFFDVQHIFKGLQQTSPTHKTVKQAKFGSSANRIPREKPETKTRNQKQDKKPYRRRLTKALYRTGA